jgi:hypothetical protein
VRYQRPAIEPQEPNDAPSGATEDAVKYERPAIERRVKLTDPVIAGTIPLSPPRRPPP